MREHPERPIFGPEDPRHDCDDEFIITNLSGAVFKQPREWRNWLEDSPGANLTGVTADETTVWPEGFDPKAFGVICG